MKADEFAAPSGTSFKFENVGDALTGVVTYVGEWEQRTNKFTGTEENVMRIGVDTGNGEISYIWPVKGRAMARALGDATTAAKTDFLPGVKLTLTFSEQVDTGKPSPMKAYKASIQAGEPVTEEEPF